MEVLNIKKGELKFVYPTDYLEIHAVCIDDLYDISANLDKDYFLALGNKNFGKPRLLATLFAETEKGVIGKQKVYTKDNLHLIAYLAFSYSSLAQLTLAFVGSTYSLNISYQRKNKDPEYFRATHAILVEGVKSYLCTFE